MRREYQGRKSIKKDAENHKLEFYKLELLDDEAWNEGAINCDYFLHITSPFTIQEPKK